MSELNGYVALVTGSAKRVGRAIALELARAGCHIVVHYRESQTEAQQTCDAVRSAGQLALCVAADLGDARSWAKLIEQAAEWMGRLDVLVNNASSFRTSSPDRINAPSFDAQMWESMLRVNLTAPVALSYYAKPHLARQGRGRIVNMCDIAAEQPWAGHLSYCASKAGLVAMTKALAKALAPEITVNGVAPGIAEFPDYYGQQIRRELIAQVPLQRPGTPEEVAKVVRFLVESDYITGEVIAIDGGRSVA